MFKILKQKKPLSKQIFYDSFNQKLKTLFDFNDDLRLEYEEFLNKFVLRNDECSLRTQCLFDVLQTFEKNFVRRDAGVGHLRVEGDTSPGGGTGGAL